MCFARIYKNRIFPEVYVPKVLSLEQFQDICKLKIEK